MRSTARLRISTSSSLSRRHHLLSSSRGVCATNSICDLLLVSPLRRCSSSSTSANSSKLAPPPPVFGFASPKPGQQPARSPSISPQSHRSAASTTMSRQLEEGEFVEHFLVFTRNVRYIMVSAQDVVLEQEGHVEVLNVCDALAEMLEDEKLALCNSRLDSVAAGGAVLTSTTSSSSSSASSSPIHVKPQQVIITQPQSLNAANATTATGALISALRVPEDIIAALRGFTERTGSVDFADVPSAVVRALVGHDGFTAQPTLDEEKFPGILNAVTRVIAPVGVFRVDHKRKVIRLRPGVAQMAARIDSSICEICLSNGSVGGRKASLSSVYATLTGTEKTFVADVGGLARIVACFPAQFSLSKDSTVVTRLGPLPPGAEQQVAQQQQFVKVQQAASNNNNKPAMTQATVAAAAAAAAVNSSSSSNSSHTSVFGAAQEVFQVVDAERKARSTTGASLLAEESILTSGDDMEE